MSDGLLQGWYMGSMVIIASLVLQAFSRPYKDKLIDLCETVSLLSTLIIFQAGMVWSMNEEVRALPFITLFCLALLSLRLVFRPGFDYF